MYSVHLTSSFLVLSEGHDRDDLRVQVLSVGLIVSGSDPDAISYTTFKEESIDTP